MLPLALIQGYHVNDVKFTLFFAAFNVAFASCCCGGWRGWA